MNLSFRKVIVSTLTLVALVFIKNGSTIAEEVTRVFLFAGQSNMVGSDAHVDRIDNYPNFKGAGEPQSDVLYSYILGNGNVASKGWVPLKPLRSFGPELTFARRVKQQADFSIAIIKSAVGGTTVALDWNAVQFACAAGANTTTRHGAQPALPMRAEVDALLKTRT